MVRDKEEKKEKKAPTFAACGIANIFLLTNFCVSKGFSIVYI